MNRRLHPAALLCAALLGACNDATLRVNLSGQDPRTTQLELQVESVLGGVADTRTRTQTGRPAVVDLRLPAGASGPATLRVRAQNGALCAVQVATVGFVPGVTPEVTVVLPAQSGPAERDCQVRLERIGLGEGTVREEECGAACCALSGERTYCDLSERPRTVQLVAKAAPGAVFLGWSGDCPDRTAPRCVLPFNRAGSLVQASFAAPPCNSAGWCWERPLPTPETLRRVHGRGPADLFALSEAGTVLRSRGDSWVRVATLAGSALHGMWTAPGGRESVLVAEEGAVYRLHDERWELPAQVPLRPGLRLFDVFGTTLEDVWIVGASGGRAAALLVPPAPAPAQDIPVRGVVGPLRAIHGAGGRRFAVGEGGAILRSEGAALVPEVSPTGADLYGVWATGADDAFAVGAACTLLRRSRDGWRQLPVPPAIKNGCDTLRAVSGTGSGDVWVSGDGGLLLRADGERLLEVARSISTGSFNGLWGASPQDLWAVGNLGAIARWDGVALRDVGQPAQPWLFGVYAADDVVWAVGQSGTILRRANGRWEQRPYERRANLFAVWRQPDGSVWIAGEGGLVLRRGAGVDDTLVEVPVVPAQSGVTCKPHWLALRGDEDALWFGGTGTTVQDAQARTVSALTFGRYNPKANRIECFAVPLAGAERFAHTVYALQPVGREADQPPGAGRVLFGGGFGGVVLDNQPASGGFVLQLSYNGGDMVVEDVNRTGAPILALTRAADGAVFATTGGSIARGVFAAATQRYVFADERIPAGDNPMVALAVAGDVVYAVGGGGAVLRRSQAGWISEPSGATNILRAVAATATGRVFAVGFQGEILTTVARP